MPGSLQEVAVETAGAREEEEWWITHPLTYGDWRVPNCNWSLWHFTAVIEKSHLLVIGAVSFSFCFFNIIQLFQQRGHRFHTFSTYADSTEGDMYETWTWIQRTKTQCVSILPWPPADSVENPGVQCYLKRPCRDLMLWKPKAVLWIIKHDWREKMLFLE